MPSPDRPAAGRPSEAPGTPSSPVDVPGRGPGAQRHRRRPEHRADPVRRHGSARWRTAARTRAARWARARSRRACCAARGTATTTTRSPASRRRASPTRSPRYDVEERADGVYVRLPEPVRARAGRSPTCWSRRWSRTASTTVFGMVGHSNLGFADAMRRAEERGELTLHRHPARGRGGVRRQRLRQAHRPAGGVLRDRRARARPTCSPACTTPSSTRRRCSRSPARCRRRCSAAARSRTSTCPRSSATSRSRPTTVQAGSDHAELAALAVKHAIDGRGVAHLVLPDEVQVLPSRRARGVAGRAGSPTGGSGPTRRPWTRAADAASRTPGGR